MSNATAKSSRRIKLRKDPRSIGRFSDSGSFLAGGRTCQSGASEGGFNFRRVMRRIKSCKRIFLLALIENGAGLLKYSRDLERVRSTAKRNVEESPVLTGGLAERGNGFLNQW